jgi:hypothetical protein
MTRKAQIALQQLQAEIQRNKTLVEKRLEGTDASSAAVISAAKYLNALNKLAEE